VVYTGFWWRSLRGKSDLEDLGVDGRIMLRWIFRKWDGVVYTGAWWGSLRGKRPLGRCERRWDDNIKMDLQEVGRGGTDRTNLTQDRDR
jgi:hypothetical protein